MLSSAAMGAGSGRYYSDMARHDYYSKGGEPLGLWEGEGARSLGLSGAIERESFLRLFRGFDQGNVALVQNAGREDRHPGWDLTFSAPKGVSVAWGLADADMRRAIEDAQRDAVRQAIAYLEEEAATTRRGKGGSSHEPAQGLVVATYLHGTSRAQDCELHTHALALNMAQREDSTWGTLVGRPLFEHKMAAGAVYRAELAVGLERLGFQTRRYYRDFEGETSSPALAAGKPKELFDIVGVPESLKAELSTRSHEISSTGAKSATAKSKAALLTRADKEHLPREELARRWRECAERHGFTPEKSRTLSDHAGREARTPELRLLDTLPGVAAQLTQGRSYFLERDFVRRVAEHAPGNGFGAGEAIRAAREYLRGSPDIVRLGRDGRGALCFTTGDLYQREAALLDAVRLSQGEAGHHVSDSNLGKAIAAVEAERSTKESAFRLSEEQRAALKHMAQSKGSMHVLEGLAGTGKTALFDAARRAWELEGYVVVGAALSGKASRGLQEGSGIKTETIAKRLLDLSRPNKLTVDDFKFKPRDDLPPDHPYNRPPPGSPEWKDFKSLNSMLKYAEGVTKSRRAAFRLTPRTVLVVDEASMAELGQVASLTDAAKEAGATIVWAGDSRQLQSIEGPSSFRAMGDVLGRAELSDIQRQREGWTRRASKNFAHGDAARALHEYALRGLVHVAHDRPEAMARLTSEWAWNGGAARPHEHAIICNTHAEARHLNRLAQIERQTAGNLGQKSIEVGGEAIHEGERILLLKNQRSYQVENGTFATVETIDTGKGLLKVALDDGTKRTLLASDYPHIALGYAATTHKLQGATVANAYVLTGGPMQDRALTYVQASRAKFETRFYTDRLEAGDRLGDLARKMERETDKSLAHDIARDDMSLNRQHFPTRSRTEAE